MPCLPDGDARLKFTWQITLCKLKILLLPMLSSLASFVYSCISGLNRAELCNNFFNFVVMELMKNIYLKDGLHLFTPIELQNVQVKWEITGLRYTEGGVHVPNMSHRYLITGMSFGAGSVVSWQ